jgi:transcriptional regulator with XRE-family HTH domain
VGVQPSFIKEWRKAKSIKQDALARALGVDRSLVSKWESGVEEIAMRHRAKILDLMGRDTADSAEIEAGRLRAFATPKSLSELDGVRLVSASAGLASIWASAQMSGTFFADHMVNEARSVLDCRQTMDAIRYGDIVMMSGTSLRQVRTPGDTSPDQLHNWHYVFRRLSGRLYVELTMEAAPPDAAVGIHKVLRLSDLVL